MSTVVLVFTQVWGYAKVWVLGRFWLRLGPRFGGAADPGFTPRSRGFVANPENPPLGSFIFFNLVPSGLALYNASGPRQTWWFRVCSGARVPAATSICSREWRVRLLILRKPRRVRCRQAGGPTAEGAWLTGARCYAMCPGPGGVPSQAFRPECQVWEITDLSR